LESLAGSDEVVEFLSVLKAGTRGVYAAGLKLFQQYYSSKGSIGGLLEQRGARMSFCLGIRRGA
jgi:hypothetical protein